MAGRVISHTDRSLVHAPFCIQYIIHVSRRKLVSTNLGRCILPSPSKGLAECRNRARNPACRGKGNVLHLALPLDAHYWAAPAVAAHQTVRRDGRILRACLASWR
jgi:hypothetical protein